MTLLEDIYLPVKNLLLNDTLLESLLEGVSKEQKEIAQRAMAKQEMQLLNRLKSYFYKKWENEKNLKQRQFEKANFIALMPYIVANINTDNDKTIEQYVKRVAGISTQWVTKDSGSKETNFDQSKDVPVINLSTRKNINDIKPADYKFSDSQAKKIQKIIRQEMIMHEYGHLFEFLKEVIETGEVEIKGTVGLALDGRYDELEDLEGKANAYAIDNMYRKDRRELLKNSQGYKKEEIIKSSKAVKAAKNQEAEKIKMTDFYVSGTNKNSKMLSKTVNSIELENAYRSQELGNIQRAADFISERFKKIGYKVPKIVCVVVDSYVKEHRDLKPMFSDPHGTKLFIDIDVYKDLAKNREALNFYLPHEIAHIITDEGHNGKKFQKCVNDWNKTYKEKTIAIPDNEDAYNQKYLPTYFKKDTWYTKQKDEKVADEGMKNKIWQENYFPY